MSGFSILTMSGALLLAASASGNYELSDDELRARCPAMITNAEMKARGLELAPIHTVHPEYPFVEETLVQPGLDLLLARVDTKGAVIDARVVKASRQSFVPGAVAAIKQWRYPEPNFDGKPTCVEVGIEVTYRFR